MHTARDEDCHISKEQMNGGVYVVIDMIRYNGSISVVS